MPSLKKFWKSTVKKVLNSRIQQIGDKISSDLIIESRKNGPKHERPSEQTSLEMSKVDRITVSETEQKPDFSSSKSNHKSNEKQNMIDDITIIGSKHEYPSKRAPLVMSKVEQIPTSKIELKPYLSSSKSSHKSKEGQNMNDENGTIGSKHKPPSKQTPSEINKVDQISISKTDLKSDLSSPKTNDRQITTITKDQTFAIKFDSLDISLLEICKQNQLISVKHITDDKNISGIKFLARGSYGQVFTAKDVNHSDVIFKESMIGSRLSDGSVIRNHQISDFVLSDLMNSQRLSLLSSDPTTLNYCSNFAKVVDNYYVYHHEKNMTTKRNEYIITKQAFGGKSLFHSDAMTPKLGLSVMSQIVASMAVAEEQLKFEHRDLHQGNILIGKTNEKYGYFRLRGKCFKIKLNGIKVTLIDNTFSRTELNNQIVFNDLTCLYAPDAGECEDKELEKCYQRMNEITGGQWSQFCPKTNIVWLQHIFSRIRIQQDRKRYCGLRLYGSESDTINLWKQDIGRFDSVFDFVENHSKFYKKTKFKPNKSSLIKIFKNVNIF